MYAVCTLLSHEDCMTETEELGAERADEADLSTLSPGVGRVVLQAEAREGQRDQAGGRSCAAGWNTRS